MHTQSSHAFGFCIRLHSYGPILSWQSYLSGEDVDEVVFHKNLIWVTHLSCMWLTNGRLGYEIWLTSSCLEGCMLLRCCLLCVCIWLATGLIADWMWLTNGRLGHCIWLRSSWLGGCIRLIDHRLGCCTWLIDRRLGCCMWLTSDCIMTYKWLAGWPYVADWLHMISQEIVVVYLNCYLVVI